jgi:flavodoxin
MKVLIVYDSVYGNTEKIAKAIGGAMASDVKVVRVSEVNPIGLEPIDTLIVGSPTQGGRPTQPIQDFLSKVPATTIKGIKVAAFDTRYAGKFVRVFGFAAEKIAGSLEAKGGNRISPPAAFFVTGKKGPLKDGELERAVGWVKEIVK